MRNIFRISIRVALLCAVFAPGRPASADELQRAADGKRVKVFILAGQSNMEGRADGRKLSPEDRARLEGVQDRVQLAFNHEPNRALDTVSPSEGIARSYKIDQIFGPELFFGIGVSEAWPDEKILLIKRTEGGTSLFGCWNSDWREENAATMEEEDKPKLYSDLIAYVRDVLSGYAADEYELCGMLWVQGESDSGKEPAESTYGENLRMLVEHARRDLGNETLPFILFQVGGGNVVEGMKQVAREVPGVTLIPQSLEPDTPDFYQKIENGHYDHEGQKKLGLKFASVFIDQYRHKGIAANKTLPYAN